MFEIIAIRKHAMVRYKYLFVRVLRNLKIKKLATTNNLILFKILVVARNRSARFRVSSALGALGRRFESCRPD